ncbi:hypothetical protein [Variovorax boronicumulans]|uniref:hypothetical protein n=1 Tax=Variovorax boronicumulans TaxID=436515 RepID=UPI0012E451A5|nr:hypothetical protein [Variovorax boronicumulans]GER17764.1 hypothetical protein VCH24_27800 [Variovorax boronicumulans]
MNKTEALAAMVEVARIGRGMTPADALTQLGELIAQESPDDPAHDVKVEKLLRLGACIWSLRRGVFLPEPPGRGMEPEEATAPARVREIAPIGTVPARVSHPAAYQPVIPALSTSVHYARAAFTPPETPPPQRP